MYYKSTRGGTDPSLAADVIKQGMAPGGGLFVPEKKPKFTLEQIGALIDSDYRERAIKIISPYLTDYSDKDIKDCVYNAYTKEKFGHSDIAPLYKLNDNVNILELWHGPTYAFKDMALQILPHFLVKAIKKTGETDEVVILVATSGDTGKAALEGFKDVDGTKIIVFYPENGVSQIQKMQMVTQPGTNVYSVGVDGNFDDTQTGVKAIFSDKILDNKMQQASYRFSSANSINWGRLLPQLVYYFSAYLDMVKRNEIKLGDAINVAVPTGNFGNILAAYYAIEMGLPVNRLICASNENNVLTDFINTGIYDRNREFKKTISPSMDILISSNLERLLFEITGGKSDLIGQWMNQLNTKGWYKIDPVYKKRISDIFWSDFSREDEILNTIKAIYNEYRYVVDTHTAIAIDVYDKYVISTGDMTKTIIASTASPFKFNTSVVKAIFGENILDGQTEFGLLEILSNKCKINIPKGLRELEGLPIKHRTICKVGEMRAQVENILGL
ncbi:MAG: threonine synthase [Clostridium sp.]|nr:threonine synthase [Clostridium sp.]